MAIDYALTAQEIIKHIGDNDNVITVTHCTTRLRFILKANIES